MVGYEIPMLAQSVGYFHAEVAVDVADAYTAVLGDDAHKSRPDIADFVVCVQKGDVLADRAACVWISETDIMSLFWGVEGVERAAESVRFIE